MKDIYKERLRWIGHVATITEQDILKKIVISSLRFMPLAARDRQDGTLEMEALNH